jgi:gliding motility-associated transport system ATP-binding protein
MCPIRSTWPNAAAPFPGAMIRAILDFVWGRRYRGPEFFSGLQVQIHSMIEVAKLSKRYGDIPAVRDVSFSAAPGQILGFLGPNGAGKTTTMRIITGFMPATSGTVRVEGFDVFEQSTEVRRRIGYLPENPPLYNDMSAETYLRFVARLKGMARSEIAHALERVLETCGLTGVRDRLLGHLSKGYRQRVGLAQALIHDPPVLILDEPTIGLDPRQIIDIRSLIKSLGGKRTVVLSTHILPEVSQVCDKVVIISEGRVVVEDLLANLTRERSLEEVFIDSITGDVGDGAHAVAAEQDA